MLMRCLDSLYQSLLRSHSLLHHPVLLDEFLYSMVYVYADNKRAHLCSRAAAREGIPVFGPRMESSGLLSVIRENIRP